MKKWRRSLWVGVVCLFMCGVQAQPAKDSLSFVEGFPIEVGLQVTTNLVFHYKIRQVDRGTGALLAKLGNDTVLLLKARDGSMPVTNLSVYTADGKLHAFYVRYAAAPSHVWWRQEEAGRAGTIMTADSLVYYSAKALAVFSNRHIRDRRYGLLWQLRGLYARSNLLFFPLQFSNHSAIDYDIGSIRFLIRDKRRARRTATQERELQPAFVQGIADRVAVDSQQVIVFALPVFALSGKRALRIIISEKNGGGRDLWLDIPPRKLRKIQRL